MFQGSIPGPLRSLIRESVARWVTVSDIYVGCSGNLTIERSIADLDFTLHGNDVQLYSCLLGSTFAGQDIRVDIKSEYAKEWGWLRKYMQAPIDRLATVLISCEMMEGLDNDNRYYQRFRNAYRDAWKTLHAETVVKLKNVSLELKDFYIGDVIEYFEKAPNDVGVLSFPPFYKDGYERMFRNIHKVFDWDEPDYEHFAEEEGIKRIIEVMREKQFWLVGTNFEYHSLKRYYRGKIKTTPQNVPMFVYSNKASRRLVMPKPNMDKIFVERLEPTATIGSHVELVKFTGSQFNTLRAEYLNPNISPAVVSLGLGVMIDRKLIGCFAFAFGPTMSDWSQKIAQPSVYMLSDFAVEPTKYKRLSKLVLLCALSQESKILVERFSKRRANSLVTTAFTNNHESMKYRGVLKKFNKKETSEGDYKYAINYGSEFGDWNLSQAYKTWQEKYSK